MIWPASSQPFRDLHSLYANIREFNMFYYLRYFSFQVILKSLNLLFKMCLNLFQMFIKRKILTVGLDSFHIQFFSCRLKEYGVMSNIKRRASKSDLHLHVSKNRISYSQIYARTSLYSLQKLLLVLYHKSVCKL